MKTTMLLIAMTLSMTLFAQDITIGTQTWQSKNSTAGTGVCYDNNSVNCDLFGKLYNWSQVANACDAGYHVPTAVEWQTLIAYTGGNPQAGRNLRATGNTYWFDPFSWPGYSQAQRDKYNAMLNGWDTYGFNMRGSGMQTKQGLFSSMLKFAYFWTSSVSPEGWPQFMANGYSNGTIFQYSTYVNNMALPVRCIKNQ